MGVARDRLRKHRKTGRRGKAPRSVNKHYRVKKYEQNPLKLVILRIPNDVIIQQKLEAKKRIARAAATLRRKQHTALDGSRIINLQCLKNFVTTISLHVALCEKSQALAAKGEEPLKLAGEVQRYGLATILKACCKGCWKTWEVAQSPKMGDSTGQFEVNVAAVWGQMATGGGCEKMNEFLGTLGVPGMQGKVFSQTEDKIGAWWKSILSAEMKEAGREEKEIAEAENSFFQGVPSVTVICDGGWSKRSHKHSYIAYSGILTYMLLLIGHIKCCCITVF